MASVRSPPWGNKPQGRTQEEEERKPARRGAVPSLLCRGHESHLRELREEVKVGRVLKCGRQLDDEVRVPALEHALPLEQDLLQLHSTRSTTSLEPSRKNPGCRHRVSPTTYPSIRVVASERLGLCDALEGVQVSAPFHLHHLDYPRRACTDYRNWQHALFIRV